MNDEFINMLFYKYKDVTNEIAKEKGYDDNIRHLLWLIMTSFVIKYGIKRENTIIKCFKETTVIKRKIKEDNVFAFFYRIILHNSNFCPQKYIVINSNVSQNFVVYFDTIVHEFNHAVNSMLNEIKLKNNEIYLRTGLSYSIYEYNGKGNIIEKGKTNEYLLEEIINTYQSQEIVNLILDINKMSIEDFEIATFLNAISKELNNKKYSSQAYSVQGYMCKELLDNRTFMSTLENLRFSGDIDNIEKWFDNIVGKEGAFKELNRLLLLSFDLAKQYSLSIFLKKRIIKKINNCNLKAGVIVNKFNSNCLYK